MGAIIARRLQLNKTKGKIHGGIYATRLANHFRIPFRSHDYLLPRVYLDHKALQAHHFLDVTNSPRDIHYNLVFSKVTCDVIPLPAPALFHSIARNRYRVMPEDITAYRNNLAAAKEEPHEWDAQVPSPQHLHLGPDGYYGWWLPS